MCDCEDSKQCWEPCGEPCGELGKDEAYVEVVDDVVNKREALLRVYRTVNGPAQAGRVWVKYRREQMDAVLDVLQQLLEAEGFSFHPIDLLPAERECCGTAPGSQHRNTCDQYRGRVVQ